MTARRTGWLVDGALAALLALGGLVLERATDGRLFTSTILLGIGVGGFVLLRLGALLARAGRTLGCLFVFAITWLLPCVALVFMLRSSELQRIVRDSPSFFLYAGLVLIVVMVMTFERMRIADVDRFTREEVAG